MKLETNLMSIAADDAACCLTALPSLAAPRSRLLWLNDLGSWLRDLLVNKTIGDINFQLFVYFFVLLFSTFVYFSLCQQQTPCGLIRREIQVIQPQVQAEADQWIP